MRSLGLPELLVIAGLVLLLLGGSRISRLFGWFGRRTKSTVDQVRWIYTSLGGSEEQEIEAEGRVGSDLVEKFLRQMPPDPDQELQALVRWIGGRLAETPEANKRHFTFQVVTAPVANAFALPGGHVFVTRALADLCADGEGEMAFLLGHEMGHVICRHMAEKKVVDTLLGAVRSGRVLGDLLGKGYSREQEREADWKAVDLARESGFPPEASLRVMRKLGELGATTSEFEQYFSTHPSTDERLDYLRERLDQPLTLDPSGTKDG